MKTKIVIVLVLILVALSTMGCGVSLAQYDIAIAEKDALVTERDALMAERDALVDEKDTLIATKDTLLIERDVLRADLKELKEVYPLRGFTTLTEFKDWIVTHVQPETGYIEDAFLNACKVQKAGMSDGYLMGIDLDSTSEESGSVFITVFIGDELYWWYVEDAESYGNYGLRR